MIELTVVICTYNRAGLLRNCLTSFTKQTVAPDKYELIVIDNNSTDDTKKVVDEYRKRLPNLMYFLEEKQGLSNARNRGYLEATGQYVGYIDDDAKASGDWVAVALKTIEEQNPDIFGGPIYPYYGDKEKPIWMKEAYNSYSVHDKSRKLVKGEFLSGSNIFFKKELLEIWNGFDVQLGMKGDSIGYHEESALQILAHKQEKLIYYSNTLIVYHFVSPEKYSILYYLYSSYKSGKDAVEVWKNEFGFDDVFGVIDDFDTIMASLEEGLKRRDKKKYPLPENYAIEKIFPNITGVGVKTTYLLKHRPSTFKDYLSFYSRTQNVTLAEIIRQYTEIKGTTLTLGDILYAYLQVEGTRITLEELLSAYTSLVKPIDPKRLLNYLAKHDLISIRQAGSMIVLKLKKMLRR